MITGRGIELYDMTIYRWSGFLLRYREFRDEVNPFPSPRDGQQGYNFHLHGTLMLSLYLKPYITMLWYTDHLVHWHTFNVSSVEDIITFSNHLYKSHIDRNLTFLIFEYIMGYRIVKSHWFNIGFAFSFGISRPIKIK